MKAGYTVAWSEGTYLTQQHFQYWDASMQTACAQAMQFNKPYAYGVSLCILDEQVLSQGICRLKQLCWISRTGQVVTYHDQIMPILQCILAEKSDAIVYLQMPYNNNCRGLSGYECHEMTAQYHVEYFQLNDFHDKNRTQEIALKRQHIALSTSSLAPEGCISVPFVRLKYKSGNYFEYDASFIPESTSIFNVQPLLEVFCRIYQSVADKVYALKKQLERKWDAQSHIEAMKWSDCLVSLNVMRQHGKSHPHDLYQLMVSLLHQAYLTKKEGLILPEYHHHDLAGTFSTIEQYLNSMLELNVLPEEDKIVLSKIDEQHYSTGPIPLAVIQNFDWYLGVSLAHDDLQWVRQFMQQVKLSSVETLPNILISALPGISLQHVQRPPSSIRIRSGFEYFKLKKHDAYWESLVIHQNMTVYLPKPFHAAELSLDIVRE